MRRTTPSKTGCRPLAVEDPGSGTLIDNQLQMRAFENALAGQYIDRLGGCAVVKRNARPGCSVMDYLLECGGGMPTWLTIFGHLLEAERTKKATAADLSRPS